MENGNKPIHPTTARNYNEQFHLIEVSHGLTKREHFAAMALQGLAATKT